MPLKRVAKVAPSNVDKLTVEGELPVRLVNYTDVYYGDRLTPDMDYMRATATPTEVAKFRVRPDDVIMTKDSETADDIGISAYVESSAPDLVCGYHLSLVRPRSANGRYLHYAIASTHARDQMSVAATGVTRFGLRSESIESLSVWVPPESEQRAIAAYLDAETARIDALITKKRRMIELLGDRCDRALDHAALPGVDYDRFSYPSDFPGDQFPTGWSNPPIGALLRQITYGFTNPMPTAIDGPFMLTANDIGNGEVHFNSARSTTADAFLTLTAKSRPEPGDILLTKDGTLGRAALFDGPPSCVNQSVAVLTPDVTQIDPELLAMLLQVPLYRDALIAEAGGTTIRHLYITRVVKQRLALPPPDQHAEFLERLRGARKGAAGAMVALKKQLHLLTEYRQALITAAVTGELEIPVAA